MQSLKIQNPPRIAETAITDEPQNANVKSAKDDSLTPAQQQQESQQAKAIAKSKLEDLSLNPTKGQLESMYNPKEIQIDKSKVDDTSKEIRGILYNGHAGLGENS
jgi:uncharacterized surface anchored protein